jgi:hypothetical protein
MHHYTRHEARQDRGMDDRPDITAKYQVLLERIRRYPVTERTAPLGPFCFQASVRDRMQ